MRALSEVIRKRDHDGRVHYYDIVKIAAAAGLNHAELQRACEAGEKLGITRQYFSKIKKNDLQQKKRKGRPMPAEHVAAIKKFWLCEAISRVSPNKRCTIKRRSRKRATGETVPVYYRQYTIREAFILFREEHPDIKCGRTSFWKHMPCNVKMPKSRQDCCPICKEAKRMIPKLEAISPATITREQADALENYKYHQKIKDQRANDFAKQLDNLEEGKAVLVMDFKANITLGRGAEEDSHVFFNAPQRTVFGVAAYFRKDGKLYKVWFPIVSQSLMHDSYTVRMMLKPVLSHAVFRYFKVKSLSFWMDNAPSHFRNLETMATFEEIKAAGQEVEVNFFAEYHGKSECDRQFGLMSRLYSEHAEKQRTADVTTTAEYLTMYKDAIRAYGGNVIPEVGSNLDELHPMDSKKLNLVALEYVVPGTAEFLQRMEDGESEFMDDGDGAAAAKSKPDKRKPTMVMSYEKRRLVFDTVSAAARREGKEFRLNYFYKFSFRAGGTLRAWLHEGTRLSDFTFKVEEKTRSEYRVKLGVSSSTLPDFSHLKRINSRRTHHLVLDEARER